MNDFLSYLAEHRKFGIKPGLETISELLDSLGNPEKDLAVIHITGTNGKGSTAAICETALRTLGYPVGRYTSPHLVSVNERFFIHGNPVSDDELNTALNEVKPAIEKLEKEVTFFEVLTAMAYVIFRNAKVKIAIMEVGMGGRFDATNTIASPLVSVITRIGLDHCSILGNTIEEIAGEKAGIIKPNRPVIVGATDKVALPVLREAALKNNSPLFYAPDYATVTVLKRSIHGQLLKIETVNHSYPQVLTKLTGSYQTENVATAVTVLEQLMQLGLDIPEKAVVEGIRTVFWPGRFQLIGVEPPMFLDGGHNPDAMHAIREALKSVQKRKNVALVAGFCSDKAVENALKELNPIIGAGWAVTIKSDRAMSAEDVAMTMRKSGIRTSIPMDDLSSAIDAASAWAQEHDSAVLICGSLFLVGEVLKLRGENPWGFDRFDANEQLTAK